MESSDTLRFPAPFIVGAPRSGTTALRLMLDSHSQLAIPPETGFLVQPQPLFKWGDRAAKFCQSVVNFPPEGPPGWNDFGIDQATYLEALRNLRSFSVSEGYRVFYRLYARRFHKPRWGDKTPSYVNSMGKIRKLLPEAHFIHLIRDGRDVAVSLRQQWFSPGPHIEQQARLWRDWVKQGIAQGRRLAGYREVRFEDLLQRPAEVLPEICQSLELPYEEDMLNFHERAPQRFREHGPRIGPNGEEILTRQQRLIQQESTTRPLDISKIGTWRKHLSQDEAGRFNKVAGDLLLQLGYPLH